MLIILKLLLPQFSLFLPPKNVSSSFYGQVKKLFPPTPFYLFLFCLFFLKFSPITINDSLNKGNAGNMCRNSGKINPFTSESNDVPVQGVAEQVQGLEVGEEGGDGSSEFEVGEGQLLNTAVVAAGGLVVRGEAIAV